MNTGTLRSFALDDLQFYDLVSFIDPALDTFDSALFPVMTRPDGVPPGDWFFARDQDIDDPLSQFRLAMFLIIHATTEYAYQLTGEPCSILTTTEQLATLTRIIAGLMGSAGAHSRHDPRFERKPTRA